MNNAVILHGTDNTPEDNWFRWLERELTDRGWKVWVPALPGNDYPDTATYTDYLLGANTNGERWSYDDGTVLIGHSSGAVAGLRLLEALPAHPDSPAPRIHAAFLVAGFKDNLGWRDEAGRLKLEGIVSAPFDWKTLRDRCGSYTLLHSHDDPFCPVSHASYLAVHLHGELVMQVGEGHFSVSTKGEKYREFPALRDMILAKSVPTD
jgi:predicted alpha/beta hydrolase family esterase